MEGFPAKGKPYASLNRGPGGFPGHADLINPSDISGLVGWFEASNLQGYNSGDPVGSWLDLSGSGNTATQATTSQQPIYTLLNGDPALLYDGSTGIGGHSRVLVTPSFDWGTTFSVYMVLIPTGTGQSFARYLETKFSSEWYLGANVDATKNDFIVNNGGASGAIGTTPRTLNQQVFLGGIFDGTTATLWENGIAVSTIAATTPTSTVWVASIGGDSAGNGGFEGYIKAVLIFNRALNAQENALLFDYLNKRFTPFYNAYYN